MNSERYRDFLIGTRLDLERVIVSLTGGPYESVADFPQTMRESVMLLQRIIETVEERVVHYDNSKASKFGQKGPQTRLLG